jgi:hypothetical protein
VCGQGAHIVHDPPQIIKQISARKLPRLPLPEKSTQIPASRRRRTVTAFQDMIPDHWRPRFWGDRRTGAITNNQLLPAK